MLQSIITKWVNQEPAAALWLVITACLVFGAAFSRSRSIDDRAWVWLRRLIEALVKALAFAGLLVMFYFILSRSYSAFNHLYASFIHEGSLSNTAWEHWRGLYGDTVVQQDLVVTQSIEGSEEPVALPTATPTGPIYYRNEKTAQTLQQTSITGFQGRVTIDPFEPGHQEDRFNGYVLSARYEYEVTNPADQPTQAEFYFPLQHNTKFYQNIHITQDGVEVTDWQAAKDGVRWAQEMATGQVEKVVIEYLTYGTNSFSYEIPTAREVKNFTLTAAINLAYFGLDTRPEDGGIQVDTKVGGRYKFITWTIDRAVLAPHLGLVMPQSWPYAPYHEMVVTLALAARAGLLFLTLAALTLLICAVPVNLRQLVLLGALFLLPFFILMSGLVPAPKGLPPAQFAGYQVKTLPVLALLPLVLAFYTLRRLPRLPVILTLALMALFMGGYAFIGLLPDEQKRNAAESMVQAGMIAYVFVLTLFVSVRSRLAEARVKREERAHAA